MGGVHWSACSKEIASESAGIAAVCESCAKAEWQVISESKTKQIEDFINIPSIIRITARPAGAQPPEPRRGDSV